jgi:hypothetical protein
MSLRWLTLANRSCTPLYFVVVEDFNDRAGPHWLSRLLVREISLTETLGKAQSGICHYFAIELGPLGKRDNEPCGHESLQF